MRGQEPGPEGQVGGHRGKWAESELEQQVTGGSVSASRDGSLSQRGVREANGKSEGQDDGRDCCQDETELEDGPGVLRAVGIPSRSFQVRLRPSP